MLCSSTYAFVYLWSFFFVFSSLILKCFCSSCIGAVKTSSTCLFLYILFLLTPSTLIVNTLLLHVYREARTIQAHTTHTRAALFNVNCPSQSPVKEVTCAGVETQSSSTHTHTHTHTQVVVSEGEKVLNGFLSLSRKARIY